MITLLEKRGAGWGVRGGAGFLVVGPLRMIIRLGPQLSHSQIGKEEIGKLVAEPGSV
jgi:hypothetical protein